MNKYYDSKIYVIKSPNTDKIYIGSTIQSLKKRFGDHYSFYNNNTNNTSSKEIIKCNDAYIELLEQYKCNNEYELRLRENYYIKINKNNCVNLISPIQLNKKIESDENKLKRLEIAQIKFYEESKLDNTSLNLENSNFNFNN